MTNKQKIEYLSRYKNLAKEYFEAKESYDYFKDKFTNVQAQKLDDMPKGSSGYDKIVNDLATLEQLEKLVNEKLSNIVDLRFRIETIILKLQSEQLRRLMTLRYLDGYKWEQICVKMSYEWAHIHRLHSSALSQMIIPDV